MNLVKYIYIAIGLILFTTQIHAQTLETLQDGGQAHVKYVIDGDTVVLKDGRTVRLVGIQAPKIPLGSANFKAWPYGILAKKYLATLISNQDVFLRIGDQAQDRHGRLLAHLIRVSDGLWVQGDLLAHGFARVYTFADNRKQAAAMLRLERQARLDKIGLWALPYYQIRTADNVRFDLGTFQIVEDRVVDVAHVKKRIYLNFGPNWRTDFTIRINDRLQKMFKNKGMNLLALKGKRLRVRGWIKEKNGPLIELDHPERLEILTP